MAQNIYDNPEFFAGYKQLRDTESGLNEVLEQPALFELLPSMAELEGLSILDLGCGMGQFSFLCAAMGAAGVIGVDISQNMLGVARERYVHPLLEFRLESMETLSFPDARFDLVVSSLALHYVEDYAELVNRVYRWLKPGGSFIYSAEHPICTAEPAMVGWERDAQGNRLFWRVDGYGKEGRREQSWYVPGVVKYHRKLSTLLNSLIKAGFTIEQVEEPEATRSSLRERPDLADESRRPPFLLIKAAKAAVSSGA